MFYSGLKQNPIPHCTPQSGSSQNFAMALAAQSQPPARATNYGKP